MSHAGDGSKRVSRRAALSWGAGIVGVGALAAVADKVGVYAGVGSHARSLFTQLTTVNIAPDSKESPSIPHGTITQMMAPSPAGIDTLLSGPDHNIWFLGQTSIGRMSLQGEVTTFSVPRSYNPPSNLVVGPDRNLWYIAPTVGQPEYAEGVRIAANGKVTQFRLTSPGTMFSSSTLLAGPDHALWYISSLFIESNGAQPAIVGRISTSGAHSQYQLPTEVNYPFAMVAGSDGNLWLLGWDVQNGRSNRISSLVRMTPAGAITQVPLPPTLNPSSLLVGPDGTIWLIDAPIPYLVLPYPGKIGHVDRSGSVTLIPQTFEHMAGTVVGPDGNLWVVAKDVIVRITPSGVVEKLDLPTADSNPSSVIVGPDKNLWMCAYTAKSGGWLTRVTPSGKVTEYPLPVPAYAPGSLIAGPDGNLWFVGKVRNFYQLAFADTIMRLTL